jgi:hypothetical protein
MNKLMLQWSKRWSNERICRLYGLTEYEVKVIKPDFHWVGPSMKGIGEKNVN